MGLPNFGIDLSFLEEGMKSLDRMAVALERLATAAEKFVDKQ